MCFHSALYAICSPALRVCCTGLVALAPGDKDVLEKVQRKVISMVSGPVLPRGRNFGRKSQKGPQKNLRGRKNWPPNFRRIFIKRAEKGPKFFKTLVLGIICGSSEINAFLSQIYPHILVEFVSFQVICSSKNKFSCGAEFVCLAAEFFQKSGRKLLKRVGNTGLASKARTLRAA
jgi:hypothetical protein